jgi:hypothetical protein
MDNPPLNVRDRLAGVALVHEAALLRLWREKRGEAEPEDLSGNLIVQLGVATESSTDPGDR